MKHKLMRITTVPISLLVLLKNQLKFMSNHFDVLAISSGGAVLEKVRVEASVNIREVNMSRKITPLADLISLIKLVALMWQEKPTIVHTHTPKAGLLGMIAARITRVPVRLHTIAGLPLLEKTGVVKWILTKTEKLTCSCATVVYPNSKGMLQIMLAHKFCSASKLKIIGQGSTTGIDTNYFNIDFQSPEALQSLKSSLNIGVEDFVFCFVGRIVGDKGIAELVTAFCNLYVQSERLILLLVGPFEVELDPLDCEIENLIKTHPGIRWVNFEKDVRPYMAISDVFVFPSYREGFPNAVMQAGAMNLPCIVSNINGCNEIIRDKVNGIIIPVKNIPALQEAMKFIHANRLVCISMALASRELIKSRFESDVLILEIFKEYQHQIASSHKAAQ